MEISEQTLVKLVDGQASVTQAVIDLRNSFDRAIPYLITKDEELAKNIQSVERRIWYFGGAGSVLGYIMSKAGEHYLSLFGGK